mgnify:FL=1
MDCDSKIVFIGYDDPNDLSPMIPYIKRLSNNVRSKELSFRIVPRGIKSYELESIVKEYVNKGYKYIGLPTDPDLIEAFANGPDGRGINIRWPKIMFMTQGYRIPDKVYPGLYTFVHNGTVEDPSLAEHNLTSHLVSPGQVYIIYQGQGDAISTGLAKQAESILRSAGIQPVAYEVGTSPDLMAQAKQNITLSLPPSPGKSVIVHIANWGVSDAYAEAAQQAGLWDVFGNRVSHVTFGNEFYPSNPL